MGLLSREKIKAPIVEALKKAIKNPTYQFHIPGHTKGNGVYSKFKNLIGEKALLLDTTDEFDGLGTLNPATGPIKKAQELAAEAFGAKQTFFLLNGSTIGNIAIAMGLSRKGQKVIVNRNCHRSVMTGLIASGADPVWIIPEKFSDWGLWGNIKPQDIEKALQENDNVAFVWITNPTYEGVVSNVKEISEICKKYNTPLVVDEAHGCLWNFDEHLPQTSLELGADIVVHSLHKTGGSMSQSSMLHIGKNSTIEPKHIENALMLLHTTSPSLTLLASLDAARAHLDSKRGQKQIQQAIENAKYLRKKIDNLPNIHQLKHDGDYETDITKIFIKADGISGKVLESILEYDFHIEIESASDVGLLILSNIGNSHKDFEYLAKCLKKISKKDYSHIPKNVKQLHMPMLTPEIKMNLQEAFYSDKEIVKKEDAINRISGEIIAECPPGIAILVPGELIKEEHLPYLESYETIEVLK
ncbi:MAG: aminotransferase class V-fold PLP-dependent enzyme [bacterium]|nr:aminotransferase class V-fold PLP-dependent enzyme [bacterium]